VHRPVTREVAARDAIGGDALTKFATRARLMERFVASRDMTCDFRPGNGEGGEDSEETFYVSRKRCVCVF